MSKKTKTLIGIVALAIFMALAIFAYNTLSDDYQAETSNYNSETATSKASDFIAYDINGNKVNLSDYFGKPIVLNFWASWCPPCKSEMPHFNKIYEEIKDDVVFLMVDMVDGSRETVEKGKAYISENDYTFPVLFDSDGSANYIYSVRTIPQTYFIDKDGNIISHIEGSMSESILRQEIDKIKAK